MWPLYVRKSSTSNVFKKYLLKVSVACVSLESGYYEIWVPGWKGFGNLLKFLYQISREKFVIKMNRLNLV